MEYASGKTFEGYWVNGRRQRAASAPDE